eukprot:4442195-Pleurochrysis_carterae.AAC.1
MALAAESSALRAILWWMGDGVECSAAVNNCHVLWLGEWLFWVRVFFLFKKLLQGPTAFARQEVSCPEAVKLARGGERHTAQEHTCKARQF